MIKINFFSYENSIVDKGKLYMNKYKVLKDKFIVYSIINEIDGNINKKYFTASEDGIRNL